MFTSVLVLLMVAPGLAFFRAYHSGKFSIRYSKLTITDQVFRSVVPAITGQLIIFWLIEECSSYSVDLQTLGVILLGSKDDTLLKTTLAEISTQLGMILSYHLAVIGIGGLLGWLIRKLVRWRKWDRKFPVLRYDNPYHYLFTGEILETKDFCAVVELGDAERIDFVFVDVVVKMDRNPMLYSGILIDYQLGSDGGMKNLYLRVVRRKYLAIQKANEASESGLMTDLYTYYDVKGDVLLIPNEQILNLNLTYFMDNEDMVKEGDKPKVKDMIVIEDSAQAYSN